jgi:hypothetical protein
MLSLLRESMRKVLRYLLMRVARPIARRVRRRLVAFEAATHDPAAIQQALLLDLLRHHAGTDFGREHRFADIGSIADFRRNLPIARYEDLEPYIARVRQGDVSALLADRRIHMFALTSGTTASRKFIPVTDSYLASYKRGWNIWGLKVYRDHPEVILRPVVQFAGDWDEFRTPSGVPCGAVTGLTAKMQMGLIRWLYCVPPCVALVKDPVAKYYLALRMSIPRRVGMIVAANPSTLIALAQTGNREKESLLKDLADGTLSDKFDIPGAVRAIVRPHLQKHPERVKQLEEIISRTGTLYPKDFWSRNCLLGNWMGGSVGAYLRHYPHYYGTRPVRDVGLIASEGRMTIPLDDGTPAGVLDITTHFFEFLPEDELDSPQPNVLLAHELREGGRYFILPTTDYGLYRYQIFDLVRVVGFHNKTPLIEFLSKGAHFANFTGEKISEYQVVAAVARVQHDLGRTLGTYSLAPVWPPEPEGQVPHYVLFVERSDLPEPGQPERFAERLETVLSELNIEYAAKRQSQRLGPLRVELVPEGFWLAWDRERLRTRGGTMEQYKHPCLIPDLKFAEETLREKKS